MNWLKRRSLLEYTAIILLVVCLGIYVSVIMNVWLPELSQKSPGAKIYKSVGHEFRLFWVGSFMALNGDLSNIYNDSRFKDVENRLTGYKEHHAWLYPPTFLLMVLPLALLPYLGSMAAWLAITLAGYVLILRRICPQPRTIFWILGFPGIGINLMVGHNGFLSGALLGGGLLFLDTSPILAGIFLGLLSYKPQLMMLIPIALLVGRRWQVLGVMVVSALGIGLVSVLVFGYGTWQAFLQNIPLGAKMTDIPFFWERMPTIYAAARTAGSGTTMAWILQGITMLGVISGVMWVWSGEAPAATRASILVLGILLFTHYAFIYDYAILALPLAWLWQEGQTNGWLSLEEPLLLCGWIMPMINFMLVSENWPSSLFMLPVSLALFFMVLRRNYVEIARIPASPASGVSVIP